MAGTDYESGLPIRSEADGLDERVQTKIVGTTTGGLGDTASNQMIVDNDKNAHVEVHGNDPAGLDVPEALTEEGRSTARGDYDAVTNTKPSSNGLVIHERVVSPDETNQVFRPTGVNSSVNSDVWVQDVGIRDEQGNPFTDENPLAVTFVDSEGTEINDPDLVVTTVAAGGSQAHIYTVTALMKFVFTAIRASASGKMKVEVEIETGVLTGVYTRKFTFFNSTAFTSVSDDLREPIKVAAGVRVRLTKYNLDNQPQTLYSTISGHEILA
ncbi:MAG: hypothetical protein SGI96_21125 [Bacteroidota bacterium]|nr:hypothetical protein [Bacteroidota bacterium]